MKNNKRKPSKAFLQAGARNFRKGRVGAAVQTFRQIKMDNSYTMRERVIAELALGYALELLDEIDKEK